MAYTTINKSTDYFNTKLYTGNGTTNTAQTGVGFQPDWTWIKSRNSASYNHMIFDAVRGATKYIKSDANSAESTLAETLKSFDTDGFTVGTEADVNNNSTTYVAWNWKAGTTGSGNTTGSGTYKTYSYSVNTTAGFSITKYTGNGNNGHTIPHSLGTTPKIVLVKELGGGDYWRLYHPALTANYNLYLNTTHAQDSASDGYITSVGSTTFGFGGSTTVTVNQDGIDYIAYCFAEKTGYSKFGSYTGNGSTDGAFVYTGFKPAWVMRKYATGGSASGEGWEMLDSTRSPSNVADERLKADSSGAESTGSNYHVDFLSNGFKCRTADNATNNSGATYIYMAFASAPLVGSNNIPCTAR